MKFPLVILIILSASALIDSSPNFEEPLKYDYYDDAVGVGTGDDTSASFSSGPVDKRGVVSRQLGSSFESSSNSNPIVETFYDLGDDDDSSIIPDDQVHHHPHHSVPHTPNTPRIISRTPQLNPSLITSNSNRIPSYNRNSNSNNYNYPPQIFKPPSVNHLALEDSSEVISSNPKNTPVVPVTSNNPKNTLKINQINFISASTEIQSTKWWSTFYTEGSGFNSGKGMDHLYLIQEFLLDLIQPKGLPEDVLNDQLFEDPIWSIKEHKTRLLGHFWGMILTSTIALCLSIIIPLFGFMICCCLCPASNSRKNRKGKSATRAKSRGASGGLHHNPSGASTSPPSAPRIKGKSGSQKYPVETKCDSCFRSIFGSFHFILLLLISFFTISAFVTNEYIRNGLKEAPVTFNQSLDDFGLYLNNTQFEVNTLLRTNFGQLEFELSDSLDNSGLIIKNRLALVSEAVALDNLTEIVSKLDDIQSDLRILSQETNELRNSLHLLSTGLHRAKKDLEKVLKECSHPVCTALKSKYNRFLLEKFRVSTKLDDLPDLTPLMTNITALLNSDIVHEVQRGKDSFDRISLKIQSAVNNTIPDIKRQIRSLGHELSLASNDINEALKIPFKDIKRAKEKIGQLDSATLEFQDYRWYSCLVASGIVLLILFCYTFGLLIGVCSDRPTVIEYNRSRSSRGSSRSGKKKPPSTFFLKFGIFLVFVSFGLLLLANIGLFLVGGLADRIGCYYLENPNEPQTKHLFHLIQKHFPNTSGSDRTTGSSSADNTTSDSSSISRMVISSSSSPAKNGSGGSPSVGVKPNIAEILSKCHQNQSLFQALNLKKFNKIQFLNSNKMIEDFNLTSLLNIKAKYGIEEKLNSFLAKVDVTPGPIIILTKDGNDLLDKLRETSLGTLNFSSFADLVNQRITPLDLISVANELESEANLLPPNMIEHSTSLKNIAIMLESYQLKVISKIHHSVERLRSGAGKIERKAQYGSKGLKEALTDLLSQAKKAQNFIESKGTEEIRKVAKGFVTDMESLLDQYSSHVVGEFETSVGKCEPVSRAVNSSVMAICKEVVLPFNGYWLSMSSALLLCLPATLSAFILSRLYRKLKRDKRDGRVSRVISDDFNLDNLDEDDVIPLAQMGVHHSSHGRKDHHSNPYAVEARRIPGGGHSYHHSTSGGPSGASAPPVTTSHGHHDPLDNWSPGAGPPHIYTRPPPYNFSPANP